MSNIPSSHFHGRLVILTAAILVCIGLWNFRFQVRSSIRAFASSCHSNLKKEKTVQDRLREYGNVVARRLEPEFKKAGIAYPPRSLVLIGLKQEKMLEVYAAGKEGNYRLIHRYPILAASGHAGPKLKEGDCQVPEGFYGIESLNPNSSYHLALRINYPNDFDHDNAIKESRDNLGGDIMIHGSADSVGCLAMGDQAAEDLFILAALTGIENIKVLLSPQDFRIHPNIQKFPSAPAWVEGLYQQMRAELSRYPRE